MTINDQLESLGFIVSNETVEITPRTSEDNVIVGGLPAGKVKFLSSMKEFKSGGFKFDALAFEVNGKVVIISESALTRPVCIGDRLVPQSPVTLTPGKEYNVVTKDGLKPVFKDRDMVLADPTWIAANGPVYVAADGTQYRGKKAVHHTITA